MNTKFSFSRIGILLRADWIEYKTSILLAIGVLFLFCLSLLVPFPYNGDSMQRIMLIYGIGSLGTLLYFCKHTGRKVNKSRHLFLSAPANTFEKYSTLLIEYLICFLCFHIVFFASVFLRELFSSSGYVISFSQLLSSIYSHKAPVLALFFLSSLIFLSYLTFRKNALMKVLAIIMIFHFIFFNTIMAVFYLKGIKLMNSGFDDSSFIHANEQFSKHIEVATMIHNPAMIILIIIVLYAGYLKLKTKEIR